MRRVILILAAIMLNGYCVSHAVEPSDVRATPDVKEPHSNTTKKPNLVSEEASPAAVADNFLIDNTWVAVELGSFEPHAINNSTQIAGDIIQDKGGPFAGVWRQGFVEKLDGTLVTLRSSAAAINDSGQIVGYQKGRYGNNYEHAVLWNNGVMQELETLSGIQSRALAINNSGNVVGWVKTYNGAKGAFIWRSGATEYLGALTSGIAINSDGQVLGTIDKGNPALWNKGLMQDLESPGEQTFTPVGAKQELVSKSESPTDIVIPTCLNDAGQVAGYICGSYAPHRTALPKSTLRRAVPQVAGCLTTEAFIWSAGKFTYLDANGKERFIPLAVNRYGMLSGKMNNRAVVWNNGKVVELNQYFKGLRGWTSTEARGINDFGQVIVYATNETPNESKAFLVTPKTKVPILIKGTRYAEVELEIPMARKVPRRQAAGESLPR